MKKKRKIVDADAARKVFAWQEERLLLYREMVKIHEEMLRDVVHEAFGPPDGVIDQVQRDMEQVGIIPKKYDV